MSPCRRIPDLTFAAEALFVSPLQPSDHPDAATVALTVDAVLGGHDPRWCAAWMAHEFGEHPDTAAARMCWCRDAVADAYQPAGATP